MRWLQTMLTTCSGSGHTLLIRASPSDIIPIWYAVECHKHLSHLLVSIILGACADPNIYLIPHLPVTSVMAHRYGMS